MKTEIVKLTQIKINGANPRLIKDDKFEKLINSLLVLPKMLELRPIVVDDTFVALGGNMRYRALVAIDGMEVDEIAQRLAGLRDYQKKTEAERQRLVAYWDEWKTSPTAPIMKASELSEDERREFIIKDNVGYGDWDMDALANAWDTEDLEDWGLELLTDGWGEQGTDGASSQNCEPANASLNDRFIVPPFSILDTRKGYWQARKKMWRELIGDMGESRNDKLISSPEIKYKDLYQRTLKHREELGVSFKEYLDKYVPDDVKEREASNVLLAGVSLLDPVMAEIVCRWFGQENCKTFDCFAGDSIFGYVSGYLGNEFTGIELRPEQAKLNNERVEGLTAHYINDDGQNVAQHIEANSQDLLFSCPPYFDLEKYSDLENDASNQETYEDFIKILENAFKSAVTCLRDNRFAVVVVGDVRDKKTGFYYDFCGDIKRIFKEAGMPLYNEIILVETCASTALRASRYMESRKVAKMHQNVLVFYKGDTKDIKSNFPKIDYTSEDDQLFADEASADGGEDNDDAPVEDTDATPVEQTEEDRLMHEIVEFRKPYIKDKLIAYEHYPKIKAAIANGDIYIERNPNTNEIEGYLWMENLKRKPLSRIYEICSARKGLGRELIERAIKIRKNPTLQLYVVDYNDNAISFYEHMGFKEVERETDKKVNNITMQYMG